MNSAEVIPVHTPIEREAQEKVLGLLAKYQKSFEAVLPKVLTPKRWMWLVVNSIRRTPALCETTPVSFINSVLLASNLGLEIRDRSAYLVPFGHECQLLIDYRGKIDLAARAGVTVFPPQLVYEADEFEYGWRGESLEFHHKPLIVQTKDGRLAPVSDRGQIVAGWTAAKTAQSQTIVVVMGLSDLERIRKRSRKGFPEKTLWELCGADISKVPYRERGPWLTDPQRMCEKTLVHQIFNRIPQSEQMSLSQDVDAATEDERGKSPLAHGMEQVIFDIDPADDRPMVTSGGETTEEKKESQRAVARRRLSNPETGKTAPRIVAELPDPLSVSDKRVECGGDLYETNEDRTAWRKLAKVTDEDVPF